LPIGVAIRDVQWIAEFSHDGEWESQILFLPLD
jgi:hypothetical protein